MFLFTSDISDVGENMKGWVTASSRYLVYIIKPTPTFSELTLLMLTGN